MSMTTLISKLKKNGYRLYVDASKCGQCLNQLLFFDSYLDQIDVVHCDDKKNKRYCDKLNFLPVWKSDSFPSGRNVIGSKLTFNEFNDLFS